jgi:hypothetical protein
MVVGRNRLNGLYFETWSCVQDNIHPHTEEEEDHVRTF